MREAAPRTIYLKDYQPPAYLIDRVTLDVDIRADDTIVRATLSVRRNPARPQADAPLELHGDEVEFVSASLDGAMLRANQYAVSDEQLTIPDVPERFTLETVSRILPQKNSRLEGLYATRSGFATQCEAEGFRRITWFIDRPDVMATYRTTVRADKTRYPVLLSN